MKRSGKNLIASSIGKMILALLLVAIVIIFSTIYFSGKKNKERKKSVYDQYGIGFNSEREKLGILVIGEGWRLADVDSGGIYWLYTSPGEMGASKLDKITYLKNEEIYRERDGYCYRIDNEIKFILNRDVNLINSCIEHVLIKYDTIMKNGESLFQVTSDTLSLKEADSVFQSWGMEQIVTPAFIKQCPTGQIP